MMANEESPLRKTTLTKTHTLKSNLPLMTLSTTSLLCFDDDYDQDLNGAQHAQYRTPRGGKYPTALCLFCL